MRRMEFFTSGLLWLAATLLMPMAMLAPVQAHGAAPTAVAAPR